MQQKERLGGIIDHTYLKGDAHKATIVKLCGEAKKFGFKTVCVMPQWLPTAVQELAGSGVLPTTVISFPEGMDPLEAKLAGIKSAIDRGAKELDMVMNRRHLKNKNYTKSLEEMTRAVEAASGVTLKIILETSELSPQEIVIACALASVAGVDFVKTSTGFATGGATYDDVLLMKQTVSNGVLVKASGGIRSLSQAKKMVEAGAARIGCSSSCEIIGELT